MESQFPKEILNQMEQSGVIAVLVIDDAAHAVPVARALFDGGVTAMELTLRTPAAINALENIRREVPEMLAGIGTVLTPDQVRQVHNVGAQFAVAPGINPRIVRAAQEVGLPFAPGIATPSDLEAAIELGCREVKFFPAETSGGLKHLKSLAAPYAHLGIRYVPLGGMNQENLSDYLGDPMILAVGGSWLAKRDTIKNQDWQTIRDQAKAAADVARLNRGNTGA